MNQIHTRTISRTARRVNGQQCKIRVSWCSQYVGGERLWGPDCCPVRLRDDPATNGLELWAPAIAGQRTGICTPERVEPTSKLSPGQYYIDILQDPEWVVPDNIDEIIPNS